MPKAIFVLGVVLLLATAARGAQAQAQSPAPPAVGTIDETQPVAVPEPSPLAVEYHRTGNWLWVGNQVWSMLVLVGVLATGLSARLRDLALRLTRQVLGSTW